MVRINPFRALRPRPESAAKVASVPYDVVNREEAAALAAGNPLSFLHVVRPEIDLPASTDPYDDAVYARAAENFRRLIDDGVLFHEAEPAVYLYRQIMQGRAQTGVVCCCHIDDYEHDLIRKHEKTRKVKEDDRTRHVLSIRANAGPVFLTYRHRTEIDALTAKETTAAPLYDFTAPDGVQHTVWKAQNTSALVDALQRLDLLYVADGHHRSASAWRAGKELKAQNPGHTGDEEYNWFLSVLFPDNQLKILPYNRIIRDFGSHSASDVLSALGKIGPLERTDNASPRKPGEFCFFIDDAWHRLTVPEASIDRNDPIESLDVALLERLVLTPIFGIGDVRTDDRIDFVGGIRGTKELEARVRSGEWACAVSMFPTTIEQLLAVADAGRIMPPKSTWFEPKLRSGLLVHTLD